MAEPLFQNTNNYSKCISGPGSLVFRKVGKGEDQNNHNPSTSEKDRRTRNSLWVISSLFVSFTLGCITKHKASNLYKSDSPDLEDSPGLASIGDGKMGTEGQGGEEIRAQPQ